LEHIIQIVKSTAPNFQAEEIRTPFRELGIDSIDLVSIRVEIEKHIGYEIPESKWYEFKNFQDVVAHIGRQQEIPKQVSDTVNDTVQRDFIIGMPQMANSGLSDNWLFKEMGDIHWQLLCKGLNTQSGSITDEAGNRLYATFTRIHLKCSPLSDFKENQQLSLIGTINRFGTLTYISNIQGKSGQHLITATLMTSFSKRGGADNLELIKSQPHVDINTIRELDTTPPFFNEYRLMRKGLMTQYNLNDTPFDLESKPEFTINYEPNPFYDINGVGLIYFAAYPVISDFCETKYFNNLDGFETWATTFKTISRDIFYYANSNATDQIIYKLNEHRFISDDTIKIGCTLLRQVDGEKMADIFTLKQRQE
jgi:acyl carrier protein